MASGNNHNRWLAYLCGQHEGAEFSSSSWVTAHAPSPEPTQNAHYSNPSINIENHWPRQSVNSTAQYMGAQNQFSKKRKVDDCGPSPGVFQEHSKVRKFNY